MPGFVEGTPTVEISLGGTSYTLGYNWAAKRRVRDYFRGLGKPVSDTHDEDYFSALIWASMDKESRSTLIVEDVAEMIGPQNEQEVGEKIRQLVSAAEPDVKTDPAAATEPTAGPSKSSTSGPLAFST